MKVSFDFDGTLSRDDVQKYAKSLMEKGIETWVVTARYDDIEKSNTIYRNYNNNDLYSITDNLKIPRENIVFMNMQDKSDFFCLNEDFIFHLDDNSTEIELINEYCKNVKGVWLYKLDPNGFNWNEICENLILLEK